MSYSLFRIGKTWHYRFQVDGVRTQKSTRETSRTRADEIAGKAYYEAKLWMRGQEVVPTLGELIADWLVVHKQTASASHLRAVDGFARLHTYQLSDLPITQLTTAEVELARNEHLAGHAVASANQWLAILKLVVNWAVKRKVVPMLPWSVRMLKVQKKPRVMLPSLSAKAWFAAIDRAAEQAPNVATCIRLMFGLGLRELEAAGARWEWIDWERQTYTPGKTKGREAVPVPMPSWLIEHLAPRRQSTGLIAPSRDGASYTSGYARQAMRKANRECDIEGLTPHRLRGTFATMLSEAGVPIQTIQQVMRHKDPMTTMKYLEANLALAAGAQNRIAARVGMAADAPPHSEN